MSEAVELADVPQLYPPVAAAAWHRERMQIGPLPTTMNSAATALWQLAGLTRRWKDPTDDLPRAMAGASGRVRKFCGFSGRPIRA